MEKQELPEGTSAPPTGVEPNEANERPTHKLHSIAEGLVSIPEANSPGTGFQVVSCGHTGLASLAETTATTLTKTDPYSPDEDTHGGSAVKRASPMEVTLGDDTDHAGLAEADLKVQSEQRAMQELYRFQKLSLQTLQAAPAEGPTVPSTAAEQYTARSDQSPLTPPISLYANLPSEWPLARISVWMRHIGVLLRVTLYRRLAELSFKKGVDFRHLPREVVQHTQKDFDTVCGAMASQLAALFAFLKSSPAALPDKEDEDLALYADPAYWLYGLLSFCAKSCEAKTTEAVGMPNFKTSKERKKECTAPALEPTRNSLALMQTVVMSFARGLYLGKAELPIEHVHIYFPVQIAHKVAAQCHALGFGEATPDRRKRYKHNVDNAANNAYVIVSVHEGQCTAGQYTPPLPETPPWHEPTKKVS